MDRINEQKIDWDRAWHQRDKAWRRKCETMQLQVEKNKIDRDLDLLLGEVNKRKRNVGTTYEEIQNDLQNFQDICQNMTVGKLIQNHLKLLFNLIGHRFALRTLLVGN